MTTLCCIFYFKVIMQKKVLTPISLQPLTSWFTPWLTPAFSRALALYLCNLSLPLCPSSRFYFFAAKLRLWGVGKWAEQSMWGFEDHLEAGARSLCGAASWTYKEMRAGEREKEREQCRGKEVWAAWFPEAAEGTGLLLSARSCIEVQSSIISSSPFTSSVISPCVCETDTVAAPLGSHHTEKPLRVLGKAGALMLKERDPVHVKPSRWQCLLSFQEVW